MSVRPARFGDIPALYALMEEMHGRSIYRDVDEIDERECKRLFMGCIQRHGQTNEGGCLVLVAERDGKVEGFIIGMLDRLYHVGRKLVATDLFFYVSERGDPRDAGRLLDEMIAWAAGAKNVVAIRPGITDAIDPDCRARALYERRGFRKAGVIYERSARPCPAS